MGPPAISVDGVALLWSQSAEPTFVRYELRRWVDDESFADSRVVASFSDPTVTDAIDPEPPLAEMVHYAINVVIKGDLAAESRPADAFRPNGPVLGFEPFDVAIHPTATIVYILDRSFVKSRLVAVDYVSKAVVADRQFEVFLQYMDVADNGYGVEVCVSRYDDGISVLDDMTLEEIAHVPMGYPTSSVATDGLGHVYVSLGTNSWSIPPIRCYDRGTWEVISEGGHYDWTRLVHIPGKTEFIEAPMGAGKGSMYHLDCDAYGQILEHTLHGSPNDGYRSPVVLSIDPTGSYFITHIWGSVYTADAMGEYLGSLPMPTGIIPLLGYSRRLFNAGEFLISVSRPDMNRSEVCLEVKRSAMILLPARLQ